MKDNYELKNPRRNPYAERMKDGYTIIIERGQDVVEQTEEQVRKSAEVQPTR